jgi:1-deoxy-D-xylulose-5-phosphate synthase
MFSIKQKYSIQFVHLLHVRKISSINYPDDLRQKKVNFSTSKELRDFIIEIVSVKKAIWRQSRCNRTNYCIALRIKSDDLLIWDVGHQAYGHIRY